jgi:hypothetical protein
MYHYFFLIDNHVEVSMIGYNLLLATVIIFFLQLWLFFFCPVSSSKSKIKKKNLSCHTGVKACPSEGGLQMVFMGRFCKFKNTKPWIAICKQRRGKPVSGVLYHVDVQIIAANGPAIKGGCVTRRQHRAGSWYFSRENVTVQGGYGALFAVMVQILLSITSVAV